MGNAKQRVENKTFINHTECHCVSRNNPVHLYHNIPTSSSATAAQNYSHSRNNCQCVKDYKVFHERVETSDEDNGLTKNNHSCRCDCESENVSCDWLKKGKDGFSIEDRRCIVDKRCLRPTCEYGQYIIQSGRCPKLEDKLAGAKRLYFD